jgi:hypothetical protein
MRMAAVGIALGLVAAPAGAQSRPYAPIPRPARLLWEQAPVEPFIQDTLPRATTGAGTATYVGAAIGAGLGFYMVRFGCGMQEGSSCSGLPYLAGLVAGGVLGAMVGSAFEGDQTPPP